MTEDVNEQLHALRAKLGTTGPTTHTGDEGRPHVGPRDLCAACMPVTGPRTLAVEANFGSTSSLTDWQRQLFKGLNCDPAGFPICQLCGFGIYGEGTVMGNIARHANQDCPSVEDSETFLRIALGSKMVERDWDSTEPRPGEPIQISPEDIEVYKPTGRQPGADSGLTISVGDGIAIRVNRDGTIRLRAQHHKIEVYWLTNKPSDGDRSVCGLRLTRKDEEE